MMVKTGRYLWAQHPHVDNDLTVGERAADGLKKWFGTWTALGLVAAVVVGWLLFAHDPGELLLNLGLSCTAAVQGIVLQIAANRGDKKSAELALATHDNGEHVKDLVEQNTTLTQQVYDLTQQQMTILAELREVRQIVTAQSHESARDGSV